MEFSLDLEYKERILSDHKSMPLHLPSKYTKDNRITYHLHNAEIGESDLEAIMTSIRQEATADSQLSERLKYIRAFPKKAENLLKRLKKF